MIRSNPQMREFAERLVAYEIKGDSSGADRAIAPERVCEKLRRQLVLLMGTAGFRSLLSRALVLAQVEAPCLQFVQVKPDGSLEVLEKARAEAEPERITAGKVVLIAQLLGLLITFIGEALTLRLMQEVWPDASFDGLNSTTKKKP
jgi:hypothetical protein